MAMVSGKQARRKRRGQEAAAGAVASSPETPSPPSGYTIRFAAADDVPRVQELLAHADAPVDPLLAESIASGRAEGTMRECLAAGNAQGFADRLRSTTYPGRTFAELAGVLVAADSDGSVRGVVAGVPPVNPLMTFYQNGIPPEKVFELACRVTKIMGLAVHPETRGLGVGSALLAHCVALYDKLDYSLIYGQYDQHRRLARYYQARRFEVLAPGEGTSLRRLGAPTSIHPTPGERLFVNWR